MSQSSSLTRSSNDAAWLPPHAAFLALWLLSIFVFWVPLKQLVSLALNDKEYSHLVVVPFISACLIYLRRSDIFRAAAYELKIGVPLALAATGLGWFLSLRLASGGEFGLTLAILAVVFVWAAAFLLSCGAAALKEARFPFLFLLLMAPVPAAAMDKIILALQTGSSELVYALFRLLGVPFFRHGFTFELPGIGIEVAKECSSIHSTWALFITGLLVGSFLLKSLPAKVCLSLLTVPIAVFTNSVRIVTLWFLATHVDIGFMYGNLHRNGGILFSLISLSVLIASLWLLRKLESLSPSAPPEAPRPEPGVL